MAAPGRAAGRCSTGSPPQSPVRAGPSRRELRPCFTPARSASRPAASLSSPHLGHRDRPGRCPGGRFTRSGWTRNRSPGRGLGKFRSSPTGVSGGGGAGVGPGQVSLKYPSQPPAQAASLQGRLPGPRPSSAASIHR